jgi:fused signal recognition particle receptor
MGFLEKLRAGLAKTRDSLVAKVSQLTSGKRKIDDGMLEHLEEILLSSDVGTATTLRVLENMKRRVKDEKYESADQLLALLRDEIANVLLINGNAEQGDVARVLESKPWVVMVVGVNGVGKTTTIGKLAHHYRKAGSKVLIGASDTFRAAANEQLEVWARRANVEIIQQQRGADPASVAFDTLNSALAKETDVVIIDTAGRLHTKTNLMEELKKIKRVIQKRLPGAPHEVLLVLDATTGQNGLQQAKQFHESVALTGLVITKLDGTAKGGIVLAVGNELNIPVKYIGVGENIEDLQPFRRLEFIEAMFGE